MVPILVVSISDTLVFLAISYRLMSNAILGDTWRERSRTFLRAEGLSGVSKRLLQSGQFYYLCVVSLLPLNLCSFELHSVTIGMSIVTTALVLTSNTPDILRAFLVPPYIALSSALACRVFRSLLLKPVESSNHLNTQKIADIMQGVKTIDYNTEYQSNFSFRSEATQETVTSSDVDSRNRTDSEVTLGGEDSFASSHDPHRSRPPGSLNNV